jgi:hypothetical protein
MNAIGKVLLGIGSCLLIIIAVASIIFYFYWEAKNKDRSMVVILTDNINNYFVKLTRLA